MRRHTYREAERFILSREFYGLKLGLQNIGSFLASIGSPQQSYQAVHIAGTNGKGSSSAMLAAVLQAQGYKTGLFTSPHLVDFRERVLVNGRMISTRSVAAFVDRYRSQLVERKLSFFEVITALGLEYFHRAQVDIAVIETGLGGRLDATNVLFPLLTVTTDISRDHVEILGSAISKLAREKAGIIKPSVPHLIGLLPPRAEEVVRARCERLGAPCHSVGECDFTLRPATMQLDFRQNGYALNGLSPSLYGTHQLKNAALVVMAASILNGSWAPISQRAVRRGIESTKWPGRFQVVRSRGLPTLVLDVGHNAGGMAAFVEAFQSRFPGQRGDVITGLVKRKEHQRMFNSLSRIARSYSLVPLRTKRSEDVRELIAGVDLRGVPTRRFRSLKTAFSRVLRECTSDDIVTIVGSHFLVGEFLKEFDVR